MTNSRKQKRNQSLVYNKLHNSDSRKKINWGDSSHLFGPRNLFRNKLIVNNITNVLKRGAVLDFGCGNGNLIEMLSALGYTCTGVEPSKSSIVYLNHRFGNNNKIKIVHGTQNFLFTTNKRFDIVTAGEVLEHIKDDDHVVSGMFRLLKPNGHCIVTVPAHQQRWSNSDVAAGHFRRYSLQNLVKLFEDVGFTVLRVYYWGFPLGRLWDRLLMRPNIENELKSNAIATSSNSRVVGLLSLLTPVLSSVFRVDMMFNFTHQGNGLLLVGQKPNSKSK